jgi:hypothetical protein
MQTPTAYLSNCLWFVCLFGIIRGNTFSLNSFSLGILLLVLTEQINIIIVITASSSSWGSSGAGGEGLSGLGGTRKRAELGRVGFDVLVPSLHVLLLGLGGDGLEDVNVSLGRCVPFQESKEKINKR